MQSRRSTADLPAHFARISKTVINFYFSELKEGKPERLKIRISLTFQKESKNALEPSS
ncbi:MAG: hypothetical protein ACP5NK_06595 [Thermoplasmata archaeon]